MEKQAILGLDKWAVDPQQLDDAQALGVSVRFKQPPMVEVLAFTDFKERGRFSRQYYRQQLKTLTRQLGVKTYELIGSRREYRGVRYQTTWGQLLSRLDDSLVDQVWIHALEGFAEKENPDDARERYFRVTLLFQIQFEGLRSYTQKYDEQVVLIKARSAEQAQEKLRSGYIPAYETPYFNGDYRLVRWKFVEFLGYDHLSVYKDWEEHMQEGIEVVSAFFNKRWQPEDYWDGRVDAPLDKV